MDLIHQRLLILVEFKNLSITSFEDNLFVHLLSMMKLNQYL